MKRGDPIAWQPFIAASLLLAITAGFGLGGLLVVAAARHAAGGRWWEAAAQAHGHIQVFGWAGLMVLGGLDALGVTDSPIDVDAERHGLGAGVVTLLILGVGAFLLPGMTGRHRLSWGLLWATAACGNVAAVLRVAPVVAPGLLSGSAAAKAMAASGLTGLVALALFGVNVAIGRSPGPGARRRSA